MAATRWKASGTPIMFAGQRCRAANGEAMLCFGQMLAKLHIAGRDVPNPFPIHAVRLGAKRRVSLCCQFYPQMSALC